MPTCTRDGGSAPDVSGGGPSAGCGPPADCGFPAEGMDMGPCTPVQDDKRLATSKQPVRDGTKRCTALFMGFLLYLLVVVVQDALTSPCVAAFHYA